jgi:hypothetical protein
MIKSMNGKTQCGECGEWFEPEELDCFGVCAECVLMRELAEILEEAGVRVLSSIGNRITAAGGYVLTVMDNLLYLGRWSTGADGRRFTVKASSVKDIYEITEIIRRDAGKEEVA